MIAPPAIAAGVMILRRLWTGCLTVSSLLVLEASLLPIITIGTILQVQLHVTFILPEVIGPIAGFTILAVATSWVIVAVLRRFSESTLSTA